MTATISAALILVCLRMLLFLSGSKDDFIRVQDREVGHGFDPLVIIAAHAVPAVVVCAGLENGWAALQKYFNYR